MLPVFVDVSCDSSDRPSTKVLSTLPCSSSVAVGFMLMTMNGWSVELQNCDRVDVGTNGKKGRENIEEKMTS